MLQRYKLYFGLCLAFLALISSAASAQAQTTATAQAPTPKVNIIIEDNLVRFAAMGEGQEWRLEVFNQTGEQVFDSGSVVNQALEWPLQDQQGQPVASGLYDYTLTIKDQTGAASRTQRGHIIVNRASSADRVWVTSSSAVGVGAPTAEPELTVVGADETTLGGAKVAEQTGRAIAESGTGRTTTESRRNEATRTVEEAAANSRTDSSDRTKNNINLLVDGSGTPGRIAKFITATSIGDSVITETSSGNLGVGTSNPGAKLHVSGGAMLLDNNQGFFINNSSAIANRALLADPFNILHIGSGGGIGFNRIDFDLGSQGNVATITNGNIGVGTTNPVTKLHVLGPGGGAVVATVEQPAGMNFFDLKSSKAGETMVRISDL